MGKINQQRMNFMPGSEAGGSRSSEISQNGSIVVDTLLEKNLIFDHRKTRRLNIGHTT